MDSTNVLDDLFIVARRHESALAIALRVGDTMTAIASSTRLRQVVGHAAIEIDIAAAGSPPRRKALFDMFLIATMAMRELLRRYPSPTDTLDSSRSQRWAAARRETKASRGGPHLFELDSKGRDLQEAHFFALHVASSKFLADLRCSTFVDTFIERSDFAYAKLDRTIWQRTCTRHSFFRDTSFTGATLDDVAFFDCDMRNADFSFSGGRGAAATSAQFIRCDLRDTRWFGRDLSKVDFMDCQLHGMVGDASPRSVSRADISPKGDGSWVMGTC